MSKTQDAFIERKVKECGKCTRHDTCNAMSKGWGCTRPKGHDGPHVACGIINHSIHTWHEYQEEEA